MAALRVLRVLASIALACSVLALPPAGVAAAADDLDGKSKQALEEEKLREEIRDLRERGGTGDDLARWAPAITAVVAVIGVFLALWRQASERAQQREQDRAERAAEALRRFDEYFTHIAENIGSERSEVRAAAAGSIATFLQPEYAAHHEQVFTLLLSALRFNRDDVSDQILVRTFETAAPVQIPALRERHPNLRLDLRGCHLPGADLRRLDLTEADLTGANLSGANLEDAIMLRVRAQRIVLDGARLTRTKLGEARLEDAQAASAEFTDCTLVSAKLTRAIAPGAQFQEARLQDAHLMEADLTGARFEQADLANTHMRKAKLDEKAMGSIARGAKRWREADLEDERKAQLEELSRAAARQRGPTPAS